MTLHEPSPPPLAIRLFGPFDARVNGQPLPPLRSRKTQWLLALLVLRHGSDLDRSWLSGQLWPDSPETLALANLRNTLADLRRALGPEGTRLRLPSSRTLSLDLSGAEADVVTFDGLVATADVTALEQAVALYRGPLLESCAEEWAFQEREAREQAYLGALERLAEVAMRRGDPATAERHLRRVIAVDGTRETAQRALMRTLADSGNYTAAIHAFQELRRHVHSTLNAEPDAETRALFDQLRAEARRRAQEPAGRRLPQPVMHGDDLQSAPPAPAAAVLPVHVEDTVTFLFTDIAGSTRLWEEHPGEMRVALARHDALLRATLETHHGQVFKTVGDAFYAAFATAADALDAALAAQRALLAEGLCVGDAGPARDNLGAMCGTGAGPPSIRVRMAVHTGAAEVRDADYFGPAVNRVARLLELAGGGQVLLSGAAHPLVQDALPEGASLRELGRHRLRDLQRPEPIYQLLHPELPDDFPALRSLSTLPHNLPQQVTRFIGREGEIAEVKRLLASTRLLTLTGAGGTGKTRLALQVAAELLDGEGDGVWLVELAALSDPDLVPQAVAAVLGVAEQPDQPLLPTLVEHLKSRRVRLVLDNCEHLLEACSRLVEALLRGTAGVTILATSREALNLPGETVFGLPPLSFPEARQLLPASAEDDFVATLAQYDAVRLFLDRAAAALPSFSLTRQNASAVAQICHRLDGIPLAIELAAARVRALSVERIAERLDDRFRLLTGGSRTALPRQQTLRALIDWSYDLLTEPERTLLRRISVFSGSGSLEAAEAVCGDDERPTPNDQREAASDESAVRRSSFVVGREDVLDLLSALVEKSLVVYDERGDGRYRLLETVRQYGKERLAEADEEAAALPRRHAEYFAGWVEQSNEAVQRGDQADWLAWYGRIDTEYDNLRAALAWAVAHDPAVALRLTGTLVHFWVQRSRYTEGCRCLEEALTAGREAAASLQAKPLAGTAWMALAQGDSQRAMTAFSAALERSRDVNDAGSLVMALTGLSQCCLSQGLREQAAALSEQSLTAARASGDEALVEKALCACSDCRCAGKP